MTCRSVVALLCALPGGLALAQQLTPELALRRMKVPDGFHARLVAAESDVRVPLRSDSAPARRAVEITAG